MYNYAENYKCCPLCGNIVTPSFEEFTCQDCGFSLTGIDYYIYMLKDHGVF